MVNAIVVLSGLVTLTGPVQAALEAADTPNALRAAFTVELTSATGKRVFSFDPRRKDTPGWQLISAEGEDSYLDDVAAHWGAAPAPDGWLVPDDLRASLGGAFQLDEFGEAWRIRFKHTPSANDGALDQWVGARVDASAWLAPESGQFLRIDYHLPKPVRGPQGGRILSYDQSYFLEPDPVYNLSIITGFSLSLTAKAGWKTIQRSYAMRVTALEVFFATPELEADYLEARAQRRLGVGAGIP